MKILVTIGLISLFGMNVHAARVHVQERSGDYSDSGPSDSRGRNMSNDPTPSPTPVAAQPRTTVQPAQHASGGHWWNRHRSTTGTGNSHVRVNTNTRVSVVQSPGWHHSGGRPYRYTYYRGHPWYGFYVGPRYYWSRWYGNRWWWYDTAYARWSFWYSGYWWCSVPGGVTYVYVNDTYVPYQPGVVAVAPPATFEAAPTDPNALPPAVEGAAAVSSQDSTATSPDGRRMVQVVGPNSEAFLYDTSSGRPVFMRYLAKDVLRVRFDGGKNGKPIQILVDYKEKSDFTLFDMEGTAQGGSIVPSATETPSPIEQEPPAPIPG